MRSIRGASLLYIMLGLIGVLYILYFIKVIYYRPNLKDYYLYFNIYYLVAIPMLFFSVAGFITLVIRDIYLIVVNGLKRRIFMLLSVVLTLIYVGFLILTFMSKEIRSIGIISVYNLMFIVYGIIFSLGIHKDRVSKGL